jgi:hypothetical protein
MQYRIHTLKIRLPRPSAVRKSLSLQLVSPLPQLSPPRPFSKSSAAHVLFPPAVSFHPSVDHKSSDAGRAVSTISLCADGWNCVFRVYADVHTFPAKADETTVILQSEFASACRGLTESGFQGPCFLAWQHDDDGELNHCGFRDVKD